MRAKVIGKRSSLLDSRSTANRYENPSVPPGSNATRRTRFEQLCSLEFALGRTAECPQSGCPFREAGGAVVPTGCMLERFFPADEWPPDLAAQWLHLRYAAERRG